MALWSTQMDSPGIWESAFKNSAYLPPKLNQASGFDLFLCLILQPPPQDWFGTLSFPICFAGHLFPQTGSVAYSQIEFSQNSPLTLSPISLHKRTQAHSFTHSVLPHLLLTTLPASCMQPSLQRLMGPAAAQMHHASSSLCPC